MLSGGELKTLYSKDFIVHEATPPTWYREGDELRKLTSLRYTPVFVFLDASGNKVLETRGFNNAREARAIHEFITKRAYLKTSYQEFIAAYPN